MRTPTPALLLSIGLSLCCAGCIVLARESYTSLRGPGSAEIEPGESFEVSPGRTGHALSHSPSLARASFASKASVTAAICDWDAGVWFVVFPPLPIPLLSPADSTVRPGTTLVRLALDGEGTWRANLGELALVGADGVRAAPDRYKLVTKRLDSSLEPCAGDVSPRASTDGAELAVFGRAELWLSFRTLDWPEFPRALEIGGLTLADEPLPSIRLEFEAGARWFWYRLFP